MKLPHWMCLVPSMQVVVVAFQVAPPSAAPPPLHPSLRKGNRSAGWTLNADRTSNSARSSNKQNKGTDFLKRIQKQTRTRLGRPEATSTSTSTNPPIQSIDPSSESGKQWFADFINAEAAKPTVAAAAAEPKKKIYTVQQGPQPLASEGDWAAFWDKQGTGYIYYFNHITGQSVWEPPTTTFPVVVLNEEMKSVAKALAEKEKATKQKTPQVKQTQKQTPTKTQSQTKPDDTPRPLATEGDWTAYFDSEKTAMVYYHNAVTGVSQWEKPSPTFPIVRLTPTMRSRIITKAEPSADVVGRARATKSIDDIFNSKKKDVSEERMSPRPDLFAQLELNVAQFVGGFVEFFTGGKRTASNDAIQNQERVHDSFTLIDIVDMFFGAPKKDTNSSSSTTIVRKEAAKPAFLFSFFADCLDDKRKN